MADHAIHAVEAPNRWSPRPVSLDRNDPLVLANYLQESHAENSSDSGDYIAGPTSTAGVGGEPFLDQTIVSICHQHRYCQFVAA